MDPVTSPLIHKDSGRRAHVDPGEKNPALPFGASQHSHLLESSRGGVPSGGAMLAKTHGQ